LKSSSFIFVIFYGDFHFVVFCGADKTMSWKIPGSERISEDLGIISVVSIVGGSYMQGIIGGLISIMALLWRLWR
jgi:hypothetical protein